MPWTLRQQCVLTWHRVRKEASYCVLPSPWRDFLTVCGWLTYRFACHRWCSYFTAKPNYNIRHKSECQTDVTGFTLPYSPWWTSTNTRKPLCFWPQYSVFLVCTMWGKCRLKWCYIAFTSHLKMYCCLPLHWSFLRGATTHPILLLPLTRMSYKRLESSKTLQPFPITHFKDSEYFSSFFFFFFPVWFPQFCSCCFYIKILL